MLSVEYHGTQGYIAGGGGGGGGARFKDKSK